MTYKVIQGHQGPRGLEENMRFPV